MKINKYAKDGKFLAVYGSVREAVYSNPGVKSVTIRNICSNKSARSNKTPNLWRYRSQFPNNDNIYIKKIKGKKGVHQYSVKGEYLTTFETVNIASKYMNLDSNVIRGCAERKGVTSIAGYLWRFTDEFRVNKNIEINFNYTRKPRPVNQYDLISGKFLRRFETIHDAELATREVQSRIRNCCKGKNFPVVLRFIWRFADEFESGEDLDVSKKYRNRSL